WDLRLRRAGLAERVAPRAGDRLYDDLDGADPRSEDEPLDARVGDGHAGTDFERDAAANRPGSDLTGRAGHRHVGGTPEGRGGEVDAVARPRRRTEPEKRLPACGARVPCLDV